MKKDFIIVFWKGFRVTRIWNKKWVFIKKIFSDFDLILKRSLQI